MYYVISLNHLRIQQMGTDFSFFHFVWIQSFIFFKPHSYVKASWILQLVWILQIFKDWQKRSEWSTRYKFSPWHLHNLRPGAQAEHRQFRGRSVAKVQRGLPGMVGLMPRSANHALRYLHHTETGLVFYEFGWMPGVWSALRVTLSEKKQNKWNLLEADTDSVTLTGGTRSRRGLFNIVPTKKYFKSIIIFKLVHCPAHRNTLRSVPDL